MSWLGIDIGGANLKAADGRGWAHSMPFALWKEPNRLSHALATLIEATSAQQVAVTMTGELCDCFATKDDGVRHILSAVDQAARSRKACVYLVDGRFASTAEASEFPYLAAASNWHALARFACRFVQQDFAVLIDIGSTTTDVIPLLDGRPRTSGFNDTDRLVNGELVYTGVGRTPICAITPKLPWRGNECPVASELFATAADAYVILECLVEQVDAPFTADGRPLTKQCAQARLARMICADSSIFNATDALDAAQCVREAQLAAIDRGLRQVLERFGRSPAEVVISGSGEFLARHLVGSHRSFDGCAELISLSYRLGPEVAISAAAHAVAVLAAETNYCNDPQMIIG